MLQLSGQLSNATVRIITPRVSWWITAQNLLSASSIAINPNPNAEPSKKGKDIKLLKKKKPFVLTEIIKENNSTPSENLSIPINNSLSNNNLSEHTKEINDKIRKATNVEEVLAISEDVQFNKNNAYTAVFVLYNWQMFGKIKITDIINDNRYIKIRKMMGMNDSAQSPYFNKKKEKYYIGPLKEFVHEEKIKRRVEKPDIGEILQTLAILAIKKERPISILNNLAIKITESKEKLNIKQLGDILYHMSVLNFYNEALIKKISKDLLTVIPANTVSSVIGSILTSISLLRYRDTELLNVLSEWILQNKDTVRPQDFNSLLMTLAHLGYIPNQFDDINKNIINSLDEGDMCHSSNWLDIVWALTVLNYSSSQHFESVLNDAYMSRLFDVPETWTSKTLKLLNVNAAASLMLPDYKGPVLPENSVLFETLIKRNKDKIELSNCIVSALKMLLPSDSIYLNTNINTKMGFMFDAEFCCDSRGTPMPINTKSNKNKVVHRIAVLACTYQEFCRESIEVIGPVKFYKKLLELKGYHVLLIPYSEMNFKNKLVTRVKYINDNLKLILPPHKSEK